MSERESADDRRGGLPCLSDFAFDRLIAGELDRSPAAGQQREHIAACPSCAARFAVLTEQAEAFRRSPMRRAQSARRSRRSPLLRALPLLLTAAAAAFVLLLTRPPAPDALRAKGGLQLSVYIKHPDGGVEPLLPGGAAAPRDAIRFRVSAPHKGFLAILSIDGAGTVTSYLPPARELYPLPAGDNQLLDGGIELDEVLGPEELLVLVCPEQHEVAQVLADVRRARTESGQAPARMSLKNAGLDCPYTKFTFQKVLRP